MNGAASSHADGALTRVLKRERKDLSDDVRRVGALPVPVLDPPYAMRTAVSDDAEMVSEWMNRPHLAETWEYAWPTARWRQHIEAQLEGTYSLPLIGTVRGSECAYLEIYWAAKDMISRHYDAEPHDIGLHAAIADLPLVNRGLGPRLLPQIVASVFAREPRCRRIMFDPDHRNTTVRRLCDYVGCRCLGEHQAPNRRMVLYALERTTQSA
ncbi:GNAT family N-acetyltransferase [Mycobacterium sherrisii]|uniref:Lysine N-acyltransferase MbtK n=1 Tax=Mycobacterium sherrisii TaxID=243061 RepID=A0A1E3T6I9_9MYCO|nr:GNAT family N-acetyltransferase [Mycobacterium sherrisii]MCV7030684.1 acetyltransferase [Mycobacterium sherrisii]MEC4762863.1 GNAT family N-acetyltransferase [Mycobacterium sherrisii]ODR10017.1 siderophore biosynthesis protein [Mycobacterium sherrisii]ORW77227.1 siderophore biosynthesis protein [Mycobacterium sherrisii]